MKNLVRRAQCEVHPVVEILSGTTPERNADCILLQPGPHSYEIDRQNLLDFLSWRIVVSNGAWVPQQCEGHKGGDMSSSFTQIYDKDIWGSSGPGSDPTTTIGYRAFVQKFIAMNPIASITDIGCGDWQSTRLLNLTDLSYVGYDVVPKVIERNRRLYGRKGVDFMIMPQDVRDIPGSDLLLMKDVLQHLSNAEIKNFSDNVFPKFKFCLITNSFAKINTNATEISWMKARQNNDIESGAFRCLDLLREPYNLKGVNIFEHFRPWEQSMTVLIIN